MHGIYLVKKSQKEKIVKNYRYSIIYKVLEFLFLAFEIQYILRKRKTI